MKTEKQIIDLLMDTLDYAYCDNCRYNDKKEIEKWHKENEGKYDADSPCEDCHRKYQQWALSKKVAKDLTRKILEII